MSQANQYYSSWQNSIGVDIDKKAALRSADNYFRYRKKHNNLSRVWILRYVIDDSRIAYGEGNMSIQSRGLQSEIGLPPFIGAGSEGGLQYQCLYKKEALQNMHAGKLT